MRSLRGGCGKRDFVSGGVADGEVPFPDGTSEVVPFAGLIFVLPNKCLEIVGGRDVRKVVGRMLERCA